MSGNPVLFHQRLHKWYEAHGRRDLPWRNTDDPYAIYVSEVMLQQTQVKTVLERYYFPFLRRFPNLKALADASQDEVLQTWQGLGYYSRARNLHAAAKQSGGMLPATVDSLQSLPGIGRNTAQAIAAFAFRQPVPVMEANVRRVLARIFALADINEAELWEKAESLIDRRNPFDYNQAMMDIGATVCTRRAPKCGICPAASLCIGKDSPENYPRAKRKKTVPVRRKTIVVRRNEQDRYFATPRTGRFLGGLFHFIETDRRSGEGALLGHIRQQYSHFTLEADVWLADAGRVSGKNWYGPEQLARLPMSMAEHKILALLDIPPIPPAL